MLKQPKALEALEALEALDALDEALEVFVSKGLGVRGRAEF